MSYTDLLESKHHYLMILKDADASRRAIERNFTNDKVDEYNKIMAIRNTAFINLIKEDVPYIEDDTKDALRITIDGEAYDMKKDKLCTLVGEEVFAKIMERSHEHAQMLEHNTQPATTNAPLQIPLNSQFPQQQPFLQSHVMPQSMGYPSYYSQMPGYSNPYMNPYGMPYAGTPYPSQVMPQMANGMMEQLTSQLNSIAEKIQPTIKEVVIDDQIRVELDATRNELKQAKQSEMEAVEKVNSTLDAIKMIRESFDAERVQKEILEGNYEALSAERDSLKEKLNSAKEIADIEKQELENRIVNLTKENEKIIKEKDDAREEMAKSFSNELAKQKAKLNIELQREQDKAKQTIEAINQEKNEAINQVKREHAKDNKYYEERLKESQKEIESIKNQSETEKEKLKNENLSKITELEDKITLIEKEKYNLQSSISRIQEDAQKQVEEAKSNADKKITALNEQNIDNTVTREMMQQVQEDANRRIAEIEEKLGETIKNLTKKVNRKEEIIRNTSKKMHAVKEEYEQRIREVEERAQNTIDTMGLSDTEVVAKIEKIAAESQEKVQQAREKLKQKEEEFKYQQEVSKEEAARKLEEKQAELEAEFEKKKTQLEELYAQEIAQKTEALEEANRRIEESESQVKLLSESIEIQKQLAYFDKETGLKNKNAFNQDFKEATNPFGFAIFGLDDIVSEDFLERGTILNYIAKELSAIFGDSVYRIREQDFGVILMEPTHIENQCVNLYDKLRTEKGIYISYGVCLASEGNTKRDMTQKAEQFKTYMSTQNKGRLLQAREDWARALREQEIKEKNHMNSVVEYQQIAFEGGKVVNKDISRDETSVNLMDNSFVEETEPPMSITPSTLIEEDYEDIEALIDYSQKTINDLENSQSISDDYEDEEDLFEKIMGGGDGN